MSGPTIPEVMAMALGRPPALPHRVRHTQDDPPDEHRVTTMGRPGRLLGVVRRVHTVNAGLVWRAYPLVGETSAHKRRADAAVAVARAAAVADALAEEAGKLLADAGYCGTVFHGDDERPAPCILAVGHGWPAGAAYRGHQSTAMQDAARAGLRELERGPR